MANRSARIARRSSLATVLGVLAVASACLLASIGTSQASKDLTRQIDPRPTSATQITNGTIYFNSDRDCHAQIYSMNPDGSGQTRLTNDSSIDADPAWSGVDSKIAFVSNRDGRFQLYTMNPDGSGQRRISDGTGNDGSPSWSPYGGRLAFTSDRTGNYEIYTMDADGSNLRRVTFTAATNLNPTWAPDGYHLAFQSNRDGNFQIYATDLVNTTRLTNGPADAEFPAWSPDQTMIAFTSTRDGNQEVYVMNVNGTNQTRLTDNPASDGLPAWSNDGTFIVFESNRDGNFQIYGMNADGSHQTRLTNNLATDENPNWGVVNPLPAFWTYTGSLNTARQRHTATFLMSGKVLVAGGSSNGSCELYDPASGAWTYTGSMNMARSGHAAVLLNDGKVLVAGGAIAGSSTELYDPTLGVWTLTGNLHAPHGNPIAILLATGKVLLAGNGSAELYDPASGTWSVTGSPHTDVLPNVAAIYNGRATRLLNGNVLLAGTGGATEIYDVPSGAWTLTGSLNPNFDHSYPPVLSLLTTGDVLGVAGQGGGITDTELYNATSATWKTVVAACCGNRKFGHAATRLQNGEVLSTGGLAATLPTSSASIYNSQSMTMNFTGTMNVSRMYHTATLLPNGRVLVVGGTNDGGSSFSWNSAETFTTYTISGQVTNGPSGLPGVQVTLSGQAYGQTSLTTTTDANGNYSFVNVQPNISYTLTPSKDGYEFTPSSRSFLSLNADQNAANFTGAPSTTPPRAFQFSAPNYAAGEGDGRVNITITRSGDPSSAASVNFATSDGTAKEGRDYTGAYGVLNFAAGEASKNVTVLIINNAFVDGNRTVNLTLSNPSGAKLGVQSTAVLTINDDDRSIGPNPIDQTRFFVQQHYYDFLGRYPDQAGWDFWTGNINNCAQQPSCIDIQRMNTSAAFFLSIEFQQTGYLVERIYKAAYGDAEGLGTGNRLIMVPIVRLNEFLPDTQRIGQGVVVGQTGWETVLENNKQAFALEFVQRPRFIGAYPINFTPAVFVNVLFNEAGVTPSSTDRNAAIGEFGSATDTRDVAARARALRDVAENATLVRNEFNRAFVLMEYFGYLRRDPNDGPYLGLPDYSGYDFWLTKLNLFGGNYINAEMVKAFITSSEYRRRFGP